MANFKFGADWAAFGKTEEQLKEYLASSNSITRRQVMLGFKDQMKKY
jgi:hypothetical protein